MASIPTKSKPRRKRLPKNRVAAAPGRRAVRLTQPVYITEDEADSLIANRRLKEPTISLEEYLRRRGHELGD